MKLPLLVVWPLELLEARVVSTSMSSRCSVAKAGNPECREAARASAILNTASACPLCSSRMPRPSRSRTVDTTVLHLK
jgi:hypothetical protein